MRDLGHLCTNSWRFGQTDLPVGGFGTYEDLFAGYESVTGEPVDAERVKFWVVFRIILVVDRVPGHGGSFSAMGQTVLSNGPPSGAGHLNARWIASISSSRALWT